MMEVRTQQSGRLEDVSPLDLLQSMGIYRRPGHVLFVHPHGRSRLWFEAGEIVDAESGALRGAAAVYRIATHDRGEYRVEVTGQAHARTIEGSGSALIFEAARRLDEGQRLRTRLPAAEAVLAVTGAGAGASEGHERVAALFEGGATVDEVLERSPLGELETLQRVVELMAAGRLADTGVVRAAGPVPLAPEDALGELALRRDALEPSQPFVPSPSYLEPAEHEAPASRRRWWVHATMGALVAGAVTLALVWGGDDVAPATASPVAVVGGSVVASSDEVVPVVQRPASVSAPAADERPVVAVGASPVSPVLGPDALAEPTPASPPAKTTKATRSTKEVHEDHKRVVFVNVRTDTTGLTFAFLAKGRVITSAAPPAYG